MKIFTYSLRAAIMLALWLPLVCHATLGDNAASVQTDQKKMRTTSESIRNNVQYRIHEMQNDSGTVVREYESSDGTIFAVTWSGPAKPDLQQLFGQYFARYQAAGGAGHGGHRHASVRDSDLVVQSSGHMRAFSGVAYLPQKVPAGVNIDEIQ